MSYGQQGVLVFTTLTKTGMPLLRYWTGDICTLTYDFSEKRTHIKMGQIVGRADDMLIIRGVNLFHTQVEAALKDIENASGNYQLIVTREGTMDAVEVKVEPARELMEALQWKHLTPETVEKHAVLAQLQQDITKKIKETIGLSMKITLSNDGTIPHSEGGKLNRILDLRKKI